MLEKLFHLKKNKTNVKTELLAGLTTFITMAYILAVNPDILSASGMDKSAVLFATAIASFIGCLLMGFMTNYPFALAPGLGLNAYFAYNVCIGMGYSYKFALLAVFIEGLIFIFLSVTGFREAMVKSVPSSLKNGISAGIGLFIVFIGFQGAGLIVPNDSTLVSLVDFNSTWSTTGLTALLAVIGLLIICFLAYRGVKGAVLIGIIATWGIGIICQLTGLLQVGGDTGIASLIPDFGSFSLGAIGANIGACFDFKGMSFNFIDLIVITFTFLYMDMFDTMGTLIGVSNDSGLLDENGSLPKAKGAFLSDAIATSVGAFFGTSTTTTFVESSAGVAVGGRTGLTAIVTGFMFLISIFLYPIFIVIPSFATAPALIYVGFLMLKVITKLEFNDVTEYVPPLLCVAAMAFSYSISDGIGVGIISYVLLALVTGKGKKTSIFLYLLALAFIAKYVFL